MHSAAKAHSATTLFRHTVWRAVCGFVGGLCVALVVRLAVGVAYYKKDLTGI